MDQSLQEKTVENDCRFQHRSDNITIVCTQFNVIVLSCSGLGKRFYPVVTVVLVGFSGPQVNTPTQSSGSPDPDRLQSETEVRSGWVGRLERWRCLSFQGVSPFTKQQTHTQTEEYYLLLLLEIIV